MELRGGRRVRASLDQAPTRQSGFASCILALPVAGMLRRFRWAVGLMTLALVECVVLALNHFRCPLTNLAARYTEDRTDNFDIYLPVWLARHNQTILGALFVVGGLLALHSNSKKKHTFWADRRLFVQLCGWFLFNRRKLGAWLG